jgi:hypothetical protein
MGHVREVNNRIENRIIRSSARKTMRAAQRGHELVKFREKSTTGAPKTQVDEHNDDTRRESDTSGADLVNKIEDTVPLSMALGECFDENDPLQLSLGTVVLYTFACAGFFLLWESEWSYGDALYFFYISLTTIGLGDKVPNHPRYALCETTFRNHNLN